MTQRNASNRHPCPPSSQLISRPLITIVGLGVICALTTPADSWAWRHTRKHMDICADGFEWYLADSDEIPEFALEVISEAFDEWMEALPCEATHTFRGVLTGHNAGYTFENLNTIYFGDPADEVSDGVLAQSLILGNATVCHQFMEDTYIIATDADLVFNDNVNWLTPEEAADPDCEEGYNLKQIALHEIGHILGLGHSCEEGEACTNPLRANAVMYWATEECADNKNLNADDISGLKSIWSGWISPESPFWISGAAPFEYCLHGDDSGSMETDPSMNIVFNVDWGDGSLAVYENETPCHTFDAPGEYIIEIDWTNELVDHPGHPSSGSSTHEAFVFPADSPGTSGDGDTGGGTEETDDAGTSESGGKGCSTPQRPPSPWGFVALLTMIRMRFRRCSEQTSN